MKNPMSRVSAVFGIPQEAMRFMLRAFLAFVVWKMAYVLVLRPSGIPDRWLLRQLGQATVRMLDMAGPDDSYSSRYMLRSQGASDPVPEPVSVLYAGGGRAMLSMEAPCNGLDLMVLSAGFVLCFPGTWRRKSLFVPLCLLSVFIMNVIRCWLLCLLWTGMPQLFEPMHKVVFNILAYSCVFGLWVAYVGQGGLSLAWSSRKGASARHQGHGGV